MVRRGARILVGADSTVIEATDAALEIVGMTLEDLRALPPGGMSVEQDRSGSAEFEAAWAETGRGPILGAGTIRLLDGRLIRVRYLVTPQSDGTYEVILERSEKPSRNRRGLTRSARCCRSGGRPSASSASSPSGARNGRPSRPRSSTSGPSTSGSRAASGSGSTAGRTPASADPSEGAAGRSVSD